MLTNDLTDSINFDEVSALGWKMLIFDVLNSCCGTDDCLVRGGSAGGKCGLASEILCGAGVCCAGYGSCVPARGEAEFEVDSREGLRSKPASRRVIDCRSSGSGRLSPQHSLSAL